MTSKYQFTFFTLYKQYIYLRLHKPKKFGTIHQHICILKTPQLSKSVNLTVKRNETEKITTFFYKK